MTSNPSIPPTVTLKQAQDMRWIGRNNKGQPMGTLIQEGKLAETDLQWLANNAYNPTHGAAAVILLDWMRTRATAAHIPTAPQPTTVNLTMTLAQASATPYPYREIKGLPMGVLLETNQIVLKDLLYVTETARDSRTREAARTLLLTRLVENANEPPPPKGMIRVVSAGRSYSLRRQLELMLEQGAYIGIVVGLAVGYLFFYLSMSALGWLLNSAATTATIELLTNLQYWVPAVFMLICTVGTISVWRNARGYLKEIAHHRQGEEGEMRVAQAIQGTLDGTWTLFQNLQLPGRNPADLDLVLVGEKGIWCLEVKTYSAPHRVRGESWQADAGKGWRTVKKNPTEQAKKDAARLAGFLRADGINQWVNPVIVWANPSAALTVDQPTVPIWRLDNLREILETLPPDRGVQPDMLARVTDKLTALCRKDAQEE